MGHSAFSWTGLPEGSIRREITLNLLNPLVLAFQVTYQHPVDKFIHNARCRAGNIGPAADARDRRAMQWQLSPLWKMREQRIRSGALACAGGQEPFQPD